MKAPKITVLEMKGAAVLLQKRPIAKVGSLHVPKGRSGMRVRLEVVKIGPDVNRCKVGDFVIIAPTAQMVQFNPWSEAEQEEIIVMSQDDILATVSYEESLIEVAGEPGIVLVHQPNKGKA